MKIRLTLVCAALCGGGLIARGAAAKPPAKAALPPPRAELTAALVQAALKSDGAYAQVVSLTDRVGARLSGSPGAARALDWGQEAMRGVGLKNVHLEPVTVPRWQRGEDRVRMTAPRDMTLAAVALGGSVPTPKGGVEAEIVEVATIDALEALPPETVRGKIVFFNKPMQRTRSFAGYGDAVGARGRGAIAAGRLGAVGAIIRSVGTGMHRLPHTGATRYEADLPKIAYAAIAAEDAELLHRQLERGAVKVAMNISSAPAGEAPSANVVGDLPGSADGGELVLISCHLDSWDLAVGAIDDASGCAVVLETARLLGQLKQPLRRTVRVVFYMNEENGLAGARAYAKAHEGELDRHVAALEADAGAGRPLAVGSDSGPEGIALLKRIAAPLKAIGASDCQGSEEAGADLTPLDGKVPLVAVPQDVSDYFDWHHTAGDTVDKVDPKTLQQTVAAFAVLTAGLADMAERLPVKAPPAPSPSPSLSAAH